MTVQIFDFMTPENVKKYHPMNAHFYHKPDVASGISTRDWLAGMAISGCINAAIDPRETASTLAQRAYRIADQMIAIRDKEFTNS